MNSKKFFLLIFSLTLSSFAQTERFIPNSVWKITDSTKLYVGASFYYIDPSDSIVVWLDTSESDKEGDLYMMIPGYPDSAMFLFSNEDVGSRINVTNILQNPIPPGTEIFFKYKRKDAHYDKYTGQNRNGIDPVDRNAYPGADFASKEFGLKPGFGYRWAVAGRIIDSLNNPTDTIIFGFEDMINNNDPTKVISDWDFNDVIFRVTGLQLNVEPFPDSIDLILPDTVTAGDTIICSAQVWFDSSGQKILKHDLDSLLKWELSGIRTNHDTLVPALKPDTARFFPATAFKNFTICVSLIDPLSKKSLTDCKSVTVLPGKPDHLSIELIADTASSGFNYNKTVQISRIIIPSNKLEQNIFAIFRDKFGNFCGFSKSTVWDTTSDALIPGLTPGCVSVSNGDSSLGEGILEKIGSGNMLVTATDIFSEDTLRDSILVNIPAADYDTIRIVKVTDTGFTPISSLELSTDSCIELWSQGLTMDTKRWVVLKSKWSSQKWELNLPAGTYTNIGFCPNDTGIGFLDIEYEGFLRAKLPVKATPGAPAKVKIYSATSPLPSNTSASAGKPMNLSLRVFDKNNVWLRNVNVTSILWDLQDDPAAASDPSALLNPNKGENVILTPLRAYRTVRVKASYGLFNDSANIRILPGSPAKVVIESHANYERSLTRAAEIDTIEIPDNAVSATVYAIIRDSMGNYIDSMRQGSWIALDTTASVQSGAHPCIGVITKNIQVKEGITAIVVTSSSFSDTAFVKLLPYHFTAVRITDKSYKPLKSLTISTNDDTVLFAQGLRSDTALWREVAVNWFKSDTLLVDPQCPSGTPSYGFSPVKPGTGIIHIKYGADETLQDTISVIFTRGEPVSAEIHLLTPPEKLIAGDTITALITILNKDGLVPGEYCFGQSLSSGQVYYSDLLGFGGRSFIPVVSSDNHKANMNKAGIRSAGLNQCFIEGKDTVKMILYYAPFDRDSLHIIQLQFGSISASSNPFRIRPSALHSLSLAHTHKCCTDSLVLRYPDEQALIYSIGYDKYGNMRGGELSYWHTTGTLHQCDTINAATRIIYGADSSIVSDDESGRLIAVSQENQLISDTLRVVIIGPLSKPIDAITRDMNGNGILDRIEISFDMPIYINSKQMLPLFSIDYNKYKFDVDSLIISPDSTHLTLFLHETVDNKTLQTDWTPLITFHNLNFALGGAVDSFEIEPHDGAGPVIKSVIKEIQDSNRKNDLVTVTFSEEVNGPNGSQFSHLKMPEEVFRVFINSTGTALTQVPFLKGIKNFNVPVLPDSVTFNTSNGNDLTERYYFDIRTDNKAYLIEDIHGNRPSVNNRKVRVEVRGSVNTELVIAPNPSRASLIRERAGEFHLRHNPNAINWVSKDKAGVAIVFQIQLDEPKTPVIGGQMVIQDMMGNTVIADPETDYKWLNLFNKDAVVSNQKHSNIIPGNWDANGAIHEFVIYWNGFTKDGKRAAPGVYRAVLKLFKKSGKEDKVTTYVGKIGIRP